MKYLLILFCIISVSVHCMGQNKKKEDGFKFALGSPGWLWELRGDTLFIDDLSKIKFVKIGEKVYKVITPEPYLEEQKMGFVLDTSYLYIGPHLITTPQAMKILPQLKLH